MSHLFAIIFVSATLLLLLGCVDSKTVDHGGGSEATSTTDIHRLVQKWRWNNRVLVFWSADQKMLIAESDRVRDRWAGWLDRDLVLLLLEPEGGVVVERFVDGGPVGTSLTASESAEMARHFDLAVDELGGASSALVGKDGGVKARYDDLVDLDSVFSRIDAMPMRQEELRGEK